MSFEDSDIFLPIIINYVQNCVNYLSRCLSLRPLPSLLADFDPISYQRLTFRRGTVYTAQFDPRGREVIYSASWDGRAPEIFATRPGTRASRALGVSSADVLSVSPSGEMASLRKETSVWVNSETGTLALSTGSGGAAREISEDVVFADWTADGEQLAVVRLINRRRQVELPIGTVLYETANLVNSLRVSPQGDVLAFGRERRATPRAGPSSFSSSTAKSDASSPDSGERQSIWRGLPMAARFGSIPLMVGNPDLHAISRAGEVRLLARSAILLRLLDVAPDGRVLVARASFRVGVMGVAPGETVERDFSWLDATEVDAISGDGKTLLLNEFGDGGGAGWSVYLRDVDGPPGPCPGDSLG